ncbi:MAG: chemotaxis protein CheW, partial [Deltaproteobacteria bacterium]|nr:chemotaxis protein CheW [Deltaproteobacteria bacterium]
MTHILGLPEQEENDEALIIVVDTGNDYMGLITDALITEENMVVKRLPAHMQGFRLVTGITIDGSGNIVCVLNISELTHHAREFAMSRKLAPGVESRKKVSILVVDDSINTREIERSILETHGY